MRSATRRPAFLALALALAARAPAWAGPPVSGYRVVATFPHATSNFTEGLFYRDGLFYEGTGINGQSGVIVTIPRTGKVVRRVDLPPQYFGEGIIDVGPDLYEWTWRSHTGFIYDRASLKPIGRFTYDGEGWGMTKAGGLIVTSNGSSTLTFRNPKTFKPVRTITVRDGGGPVEQLNELEYVKGEILANVWMTSHIARISPADGHVIGWIDLTGLSPVDSRLQPDAVLNGIAYDAKNDRLFVTGKLWPAIYQIRIVKRTRG
jgi:glutaminyl-peptide cyclotransferase